MEHCGHVGCRAPSNLGSVVTESFLVVSRDSASQPAHFVMSGSMANGYRLFALRQVPV